MIVYFPESILFILILVALVMISAAFIILLILLFKDIKTKEVW